MKRQIRRGVFETNSSSTHSLQICSKDEYDRWKNGELVFDSYEDDFIEKEFITNLTDEDKECVKIDYEERKQKYWKSWDELTEQEQEELYQEEINSKLSNKYRYKTYRDYMYNNSLETFEEHYTSVSGDKIVCFGKYGYD